MKIVLYGINSATDTCIRQYRDTYDITLATTTGDKPYGGREVLSLQQLAEIDETGIERIIICSMYVNEIAASLLETGFSLEQIFFYDLQSWQVKPCQDHLIEPIDQNDILYAFYDLSCNLLTFDVMTFCAIAEAERKLKNKKHIHFIIVPNKSHQDDYLCIQTNHTQDDTQWRSEHIAIALFNCIESTVGVSQLATREEASFYTQNKIACFPENYDPQKRHYAIQIPQFRQYLDQGMSLSCLHAPQQAKSLVSAFLDENLKGRKLIVITLREYNAQAERNSDYKAWAGFLNSLDTDTYFPVLVRDTYKSTSQLPEELEKYHDFPTASVNLCIRIALYEAAFLNIGTSTGPVFLFNFIKGLASIIFIPPLENTPTANVQTNARSGIIPGEHTFFRENENQWLLWQQPTQENLTTAFSEMVSQLPSA